MALGSLGLHQRVREDGALGLPLPVTLETLAAGSSHAPAPQVRETVIGREPVDPTVESARALEARELPEYAEPDRLEQILRVILIDGELAADSRLTDLLASDTVRISLAAATADVEKTLSGVDGVGQVRRLGPDTGHDGYEIWTARFTSAQPPTPAIVQAAGRAGWKVASISAETQNLEQVFRDLMSAHVARRETAGDPAR